MRRVRRARRMRDEGATRAPFAIAEAERALPVPATIGASWADRAPVLLVGAEGFEPPTLAL